MHNLTRAWHAKQEQQMTYPWLDECTQLRAEGVPFRELSERYGVSIGTISAALWRHKRGNRIANGDVPLKDGATYEKRALKILEERCAAVEELLRQGVLTPQHEEVLRAYAEGYNSKACGARVGRSKNWANVLLRRYGLPTDRYFRYRTLENALRLDNRKK